MKLKFPEKRFRGRAIAAMGVCLVGAWTLQSCDNDDLEGQPTWLGESIYEQLQQEGEFKNMLRLIDDLNYASVMSKTGSKTLFAASDEAFDEWYKTNPWGVKCYEDLSNAQKKLLLNSAMVNNAYLVELLSNVEAEPEPLEGLCMRRESAISVYDSVSRILPADMPQTRYWDEHRGKREGIVLLKDDNSQPMIHFLPRFMSMNNITGEDLRILTNGQSNTIQDAWVNGKKIVERDITCKNGYIHKVDGVMLSSDNMAQIVRNHANMSQWSTLLDRFCAPYYDEQATQDYQRLYGGNDSVFVLRYFSSQNKQELETAPDRTLVEAKLAFDPGWNHYMYTNTAGKDLHYDCGALLVPTNEALDAWWNGEGYALQDQYKEWSRVPDQVLVELLNVNMVSEFVKTVPSKFQNIVNDAKVEMGVQVSHIDSCFMGCNGVVYLTNKVFSPATYSSVAFPALVHTETMNIIYWGIDKLGFKPYLNSMDSYYSFFVPTNNGMLRYVDPCSFGSTTTIMYEFFWDVDRQTVGAHRYNYDMATNTVSDAIGDASASQVENRMKDLLDNLIVVGNVEDGNTFYRTKNGSTIRVENPGTSGMTISAGLQIEQSRPVPVTQIFDQTKNGNGKAYVVESEVPMTSSKSVYKTLSEHPEYSRFFNLLSGGDPDSAQYNLTLAMIDNQYSCVDYNIRLFDNYHYTVWVPTNESLDALHEAGILPYWDDLDAQTDSAWSGNRDAAKVMKYKIRTRILDFLRYHIQDNAIFMGEGVVDGRYETSKLNPVNKKFYSLAVNANNSSISVTDALGNTRQVQTADRNLYNNMCREYLYTQKDKEVAYKGNLYSSSHAVVHLIDGPLMFSESQLEPMDWTPQPTN